MKRKIIYIFATLSLLTITLFCAFSIADDDSFDLAKQEIRLRKIGHELLLQSGDSLSRVFPVKKIAENEYRLTFENEFSFKSDSLVAIVKRSLASNSLGNDYLVNVVSCDKKEVVFGYAILGNIKDDIIACTGRYQPKNCYYINIKFQSTGMSTRQKGYLLGSLPWLAFVGLLITKSGNKPTQVPLKTVRLGNTVYNEVDKTISIEGIKIALTLKENKLLSIFAKSPNIMVERSRLQKEIWEDEGVIVGRSLDVFVSRLRKKLEDDTSLQLINIHNKGYKLEVH
ncbi:winged helix-turn-helix domain-containing protein [Pedobacter sp. Du54]|uniref:helix-turn-helix domain-containing protein n=1 Tax=Pedobacter anseongensis TaxID=3133439 RepID=UPI003097B361